MKIYGIEITELDRENIARVFHGKGQSETRASTKQVRDYFQTQLYIALGEIDDTDPQD